MQARQFRHPAAAVSLLLFATAAWSGSVVPVIWQMGWNSPLNQDDDVMLLRAAGDGGALTLVLSHGQHVSLVRYDADGKLAWNHAQLDLAGAPGDLVVAADGSAVLAALSVDRTQLIVRRFDSVTGTMYWQRARPVILTPILGSYYGPKLAIDADTGLIRVAVSQQDDWLIVSYAEDGTAGPQLIVGEPDRVDVPLAIVAGRDGGFVITGYEFETSTGTRGAIRTIAFDPDDKLRYSDRERGDIGSLFYNVPAWLAMADDGGLYVLGGPESHCGVGQYRVWKLDATGEREWTTVQPENSCDSFEPVGFSLLADGSVIIVSSGVGVNLQFLVTRIGASGEVRWHRSWDGTTGAALAIPIAAAVNAAGRTRVVGSESVPPSSGRYVVAEWTADGSLCVAGRDPGLWRGIDIVALADGWLVGANGAGPGATPDAYTLRYPAADQCTVDELFRDDFEAP